MDGLLWAAGGYPAANSAARPYAVCANLGFVVTTVHACRDLGSPLRLCCFLNQGSGLLYVPIAHLYKFYFRFSGNEFLLN
jgi:hypothetical protein